MKIAEHFELVKQQYRDRAAALQEGLQRITEQITAKNAELKWIKKDRKKMQDLLADPPAHAFDTAKANEAIAGWDAQVAQYEADIKSLLAEKSSLEVTADDQDFARVDLFLSLLLKVEKSEEAQDVHTFDDCWPRLPVTIEELDDAGRPKICRIYLGGSESRTLKIEGNENRFAKDFRPPGLRWLPSLQESSANGHGNGSSEGAQLCVFLDQSRRLIVSRTKLRWMTERNPAYHTYSQRNESQHEHHEEDFSDIACSLAAQFDETARAENGAVNLNRDYSGNALLLHIQKVVLAKTTAEPEFEPVDEELKSSEIEKRIKEPWLAFVGCPWSGSIRGNLALLKYSAENGERVRFWSGEFKNLYGFRVRTRDHNWLVGEIFIGIPAEASAGKLSVERTYGETVATIGTLSVHVAGSND